MALETDSIQKGTLMFHNNNYHIFFQIKTGTNFLWYKCISKRLHFDRWKIFEFSDCKAYKNGECIYER